MKVDFIRLHKSNDNSTIIVNVADIVYIDTGENEKKDALIILKDKRIAPFYVNETPDKIHKFLNEQFVRLHKSNDNTTIIVNVGDIVYVDTGENEKKDALIILKDTRVAPFYVNETPDKICKLLKTNL
jgi:DNA-binding LytR/AlgR family response regulator